MSEELIGEQAIRGTEATGLTVECAWNVGKAVAEFLPQPGDVTVVSVPTHEHIAGAVIEGLRLQGRTVINGGSGDSTAAKSHIMTARLAGAVVIGFDQTNQVITIEVFRHDAQRVDNQSGLAQIRALVEAGNFMPAGNRGELTHLV